MGQRIKSVCLSGPCSLDREGKIQENMVDRCFSYCDTTAEARIMQFLLKCSPALVFACQVRNSKGVRVIGGSNWGGVVSDFAMLYLRNGARYSLGNS